MAKDILLDENGDLQIKDGDLVIGTSDAQHQHDLLVARKGDYREHPTIGIDIFSWVDDDEPGSLVREMYREFQRDGMTVTKNDGIVNGKVIIEGNYD